MKIEWEDPSPSRRLTKTLLEPALLQILRKNPNRWAVVAKDLSYVQASNRATRCRAKYPGFQFSIRKGPQPGSGLLYARFVADDE